MVLALLLVASETGEKVKPLQAKSLLLTLAVIVVICGAIMLAGFGFFSPSDEGETKAH